MQRTLFDPSAPPTGLPPPPPPAPRVSIASVTKSIRKIMRQDAGVDGDAQRIGQLGWMIFLKLFDAQETEYELFDPAYRSPIPGGLRWRNWAADDEGVTGDELLDLVDTLLFPVLKGERVDIGDGEPLALDTSTGAGRMVRSVFEDAYNYMKSGTLLRQVANKLDEIDFSSSEDRHAFNDVYESILRELQSAGDSGEYYTPRAVTQVMTALTDPRLGEVVLDPACGTGGFLVDAIQHLGQSGIDTLAEGDTLQDTIRGVEKKQLPHLLATTNLVLHDVRAPAVRHDNTLAKPYASYGPADRVDVVLTNPPFGGTEEDGIENNFPQKFRTRETADLFMALILRLLKKGGRAAVVLPDGFLFGEGVKTRLKEALLAEADLHTVVRLPKGVFAPYTDITTNLLFFEKGTPTEAIWFVEHPLPEGYKNYTKTKPIRSSEFAYLRDWWGNREATDFAWRVPIAETIEAAREKARPHWEAAEAASKQAERLRAEIRDLDRGDDRAAGLQERVEAHEDTARTERAAGDALYNAAFNLDLRHPAQEEAEDTRTTAEVLEDLTGHVTAVEDLLAQIKASLSNPAAL